MGRFSRGRRAAVGAMLGLTLASNAQAINFIFDYTGDVNEGFNDPTLGAQRQTAFQTAAGIWGGLLPASYAGETVKITATFDPLGGTANSATLGQAGPNSNYFSSQFTSTSPKKRTNTVYVGALANHLAKMDLSANGAGAAGAEIRAQFNSDVDGPVVFGSNGFYYGTDANPTAGNVDFETVALHELGHGLGFYTELGSDGAFLNGQPQAFDNFLYRKSTSTFLTAETAAQRAADVISNDLYFNGAAANAAAGGPAKLYAPATFAPGSSIAHTDDTTFPTDLMKHLYPGVQHTPSGVDLGVFSDIGWDVAVPEPAGATAGLTLGAGCLLRRRRRKTAAPAC